MTFAYLNEETLRDVQRAATAAGFASDGQLAALSAGISPAFIATYTVGGNGNAKLITLTTKMNTTRVLLSGEVPLTKWLNNAILLAGGVAEEAVFRRALEQASVDGAASPVESAPGAAAPATPLDELFLTHHESRESQKNGTRVSKVHLCGRKPRHPRHRTLRQDRR